MTTPISEADLQGSVIVAARELGWLVYHTRNSRQSEPGFVDLVMVKSPRIIFAEIKTEKGRIRKGHWNKAGSRWLPGQDTWAEALQACPGVEYMLVRPSNVELVYERLAR
jgi:hypothetical protein